jgi:hypothetical protein
MGNPPLLLVAMNFINIYSYENHSSQAYVEGLITLGTVAKNDSVSWPQQDLVKG